MQDKQREAERLGYVAGHYRDSIETCPYTENDPLRVHWCSGHTIASKHNNRLDMRSSMAAGYRAFKDGLKKSEYRGAVRTEAHSEWTTGWEKAKADKEKQGEESYR